MLRVTTHFDSFVGGPYVTEMHFTGTDQTAADSAALAVHDFWDDVKGTICGPGFINIDPAVLEINSSTGQPEGVFFSTVAQVAPGLSSDPLPLGTQGCIITRTGHYVNGREIRGRIYVPRPTEGHNGTGTPDATYRGILDTAVATLLATTGVELLAWSKTHGIQQPVSQAQCSNNWARLLSRR